MEALRNANTRKSYEQLRVKNKYARDYRSCECYYYMYIEKFFALVYNKEPIRVRCTVNTQILNSLGKSEISSLFFIFNVCNYKYVYFESSLYPV